MKIKDPKIVEPYLDIFLNMIEELKWVKQDPNLHPEICAYSHSIQSFAIAVSKWPQNCDLILATLLHDLGKTIQTKGHSDASVKLLLPFSYIISDETFWLIKHHMDKEIPEAKESLKKDLTKLKSADRLGRLADWKNDWSRDRIKKAILDSL